MKNTHTPWEFDAMERSVYSKSGGHLIAKVAIRPKTVGIDDIDSMGWSIETKANAELIVKAVNHHDQLVEALKDCIARMKRARNILQTGATPGHWGLLDTDSISQLLNSIDNGK